MSRPFFAPIPTTFRLPQGSVMSDNNLLVAWSRFKTDSIRSMIADYEARLHRLSTEDKRALEARRRVLALREAKEAKATIQPLSGGEG